MRLEIFAKNLRRIMEIRCMSKTELAIRSGKSRQQIIRWCQGKSRPKCSSLGTLARALGTNVKELIGDD